MSLLDDTLGALEIGIIFSIFLYGIFTIQTYLYTQGRISDPLWIKFLVSYLSMYVADAHGLWERFCWFGQLYTLLLIDAMNNPLWRTGYSRLHTLSLSVYFCTTLR